MEFLKKQYFYPPKLGSLYIGLLKTFRKIFSPHINSIAPPLENQLVSTGVSLSCKNHKHIFENGFLTFPVLWQYYIMLKNETDYKPYKNSENEKTVGGTNEEVFVHDLYNSTCTNENPHMDCIVHQ